MYSEKVIEHFMHPRNIGEIDDADAVGEAGNASCGDSMKMYLKIEDDTIIDVKFKTFGCGAAIASSSIATEMIKNKTIQEALEIDAENIQEALGGLPPEKVHCSVMAVDALKSGIKVYNNRS